MSDIRVGIKLTTDGSGKVTAEITQVKKGLEETGKAAEQAGNKQRKAAEDTKAAYSGLASQIDGVKRAFLAYVSVQAAWQGSKAILDATAQMDRLRGMMDAASGSTALSAQNMAFVDRSAKTLGINLSAAAEGFANISAAAQGTALQGQATRDIFTAVAKASAALGKSSADTMSMIQALGQMISKGTVSMEELRGQLGDRLPGAFQISARAMGMTTQELDKLIASGNLTAEEFLPKLAKALDETYSGARFDRLNNQLERLDNAWLKLKANVLDSDAMARVINNLATILEKFGGDSASALNKTREKIKELRAELAELETQMAKPWWTRPVDISITAPGKIEDIKKEISGLENRAGGLEKLQAAPQAVEQSAQRQIQALGQVGKAWAKLTEAQRGYFEAAAKKYNLPQELLMAQFYQESRFNPNARSGAGAYGLGQLMPGTGRSLAAQEGQRYDPTNELQNVMLGAKYLRQNLDKFNGNVKQALASYNAGPGAVMSYGVTGKPYYDRGRWKNTAGTITQSGIPPFKETQDYVDMILNKWLPQIKGGNLKGIEAKAIKLDANKLGKELRDAQNQQYEDYVAHLKLREQAFDDDAKRKLAQQKTLMEQLQAQEQAARASADDAKAIGNFDAMKAAEAEQINLIKARTDALLQAVSIEEQATKKRLGNIGMEIAKAQEAHKFDDVAKGRASRESEQAELNALTERRKQIEIQAQTEIQAVNRKSANEQRAMDQQRAADSVAILREEREGNEALFEVKSRAADYSRAVMAQYADDQMAAIDAGLEQARNQVAANEAERAQLLQTKDGMAAILQERENITASLTDGLSLLDLERQAALDKLNIDAQQLDYQRQIAEWQLQQTQAIDPNNQDAILAARQKVLEIEGQITDNAQKQLDAMNAQTGQQAKLRAEAAKALAANTTKNVKETQLEQNAFWDQALQRAQQYAATWERIVGAQSESGKAMAELSVAMVQYGKNITQIEQRYKDLGSDENVATGQTKQRDLLRENLDIMSKTALTMRSMFKEGTQGYAAMTAAAGAMQIAVQALNIVDGISAVLNQLKGSDPYSAIPRALAVAGMVASLGVSIGGMGGGAIGGETRPPGRQTGENGGVFGDNSAQSQSLVNSLELLAANSSADLSYSAGMLRALKNIEAAMSGVTNAVIRGVSPDIGNQKLGHTAIGSGIFAGVDKYISDFGLQHWGQKLSDIIKTGFEANVFTEITRETKVFGTTFKKDIRTKFSGLDKDVADQFTRVIINMADAVKAAGKSFGLNADDFSSRLKGFVVNLGKTSFQGLKGEELQKAITAMFSKASDAMARAFMPGLEEFQRVGEGYFETLTRVASGIDTASGLLSQFGIAAIRYTDIALKQGDVASEIVRQSIVAYEGLFSTIGKYIDGAVGSAEDLLAVYQDLLSIRAMSSVVGLSFRNLSNDMIVAAGGVAALKDSISFYLENFIGIGGIAAAKTAEVSDAFRRLGMRMPETQDAFRQLVNSVDQTTSSGQKLWAQLLKLAPAFLEAKQAAQDLADLRTKLKGGNPFAEMDSSWKQLWKDWGTVMDGELAMVGGPFQAKIKAQQDAIQGWAQAISAGTASIGMLTGELVRLSIAKAPASVLKSVEQAIVTLTKNVSEWQKKIKEANKAIEDFKDDQDAATAAKRQEILKEQGWSLIGSIADMWEKMISGIRAAVASMQDQIDQLQPNAAQAVYNTASGRVTDAYANLADYRSRMAGMGQATDPTVELGYIQQIQNAIMARYNAELALLQKAQQEMVAAETERLNAALDATIAAINAELDAKIAAINAALDAEIQAINDALDARIKAQQKADEAVIKSMQKALEQRIKAQQKADEAVIKALQKRFDAENKAIQKQFDAIIKARQKEYDAANKILQRQFDDERKALQKRQDAQMKVLTDELDAANKLRDAIKGIADYAQAMKLGAASPLSPEQKLAEAQRQYQELLSKANAGDADAMAKLSGASDAYLEAARNYYGSGTNYEDIFKGVQQAMESIGGMSAPDPNSIQSRIDALRDAQEKEMQALQDKQDEIMDTIREQQQEAIDALRETQQDQLDAIRESQQEQVDAIREAQQDNIDAMREAAQDQIDAVREAQQANIEAMRKAAQDQIEAARKAAQDQIEAARKIANDQIEAERKITQQKIADLADPENNQAIKDLKEKTIAELQALQKQARDLEDQAKIKAEAWITEVRTWMTQQNTNDSDMLTALRGIYTGITQKPPPFANGGQAMPGYAMVGEQGPEIVRFNTPGQVYTASETKRMLQPGTDEETKTILREIKTEAKASVTVQSNAFQKMIDKLNLLDDRINSMERNQRLSQSGDATRRDYKPYVTR